MSRSDSSTPPQVDLVPSHVGAQGDAVAEHEGQRVFIPFALPGERIRATLRARSGGELAAEDPEVVAASPERVAPPCRHFGVCGGCKLQHWAEAPYRAWKVGLVRAALRRRGLELPERPQTVFLPAGDRRRAEFAATKQGGRVSLGFQEARSHRIADLRECPLLLPRLAQLVAPLRAVLTDVLADGQSVDILATATETGFDLLIGGGQTPTSTQRQALAQFATRHDAARISWRGGRGTPEPIVMLRPPQLHFGGVAVDLPVPSFLQPSEAGEAALRSAMLAMLDKPKRILELYAGSGTFTFDLARLARVHAVEASRPALQALDHAAHRAQMSHRVTTELRDLERAPLTALELKKCDTVVFDPPRAGAGPQSTILAKSAVPNVIAISCNPATFARDARLLADGGYRLAALAIIDQFTWSAHVEVVARFRNRP